MDMKQLALVLGLSATIAGCDQGAAPQNTQNAQNTQGSAAATQGADIYAAEYKADNLSWKIKADSEFTIPLSIKNTSAASWDSTAAKPVNLSYHWLDGKSKGVLLNDGLRTSFSKPVAAGEEVKVQLLAKAPEKPGTYIMQVGLVHEGVIWFEHKQVKPIELTIRVE